MSIIAYVTAIFGLVYNIVLLSVKFFKAPAKVITLLETIEEPLMIIVIAVLAYFGVQATADASYLQGLINNIQPVVEAVIE